MAFSPKQKLSGNLSALRIAFALKEGEAPDASQLAVLSAYAGFGGIKAVMYGDGPREYWQSRGATADDLRLYDGMTELYQFLKQQLDVGEYKKAVDALKNSALSAYYTPDFVPQAIYRALQNAVIEPTRIYDPSAGAGVFLTTAIDAFPNLAGINAVEKDLLTGKVLQAIMAGRPVNTQVQVKGFEETPNEENGKYDLITSNIPFGNYRVFDRDYTNMALSGRIHTYFFVKGLDKLADGGIMAFLTTDAFLNSPGNQDAREHLFNRADFIALAQLPANLMKEHSGVEASTHLLVVQKRNGKTELSESEQLLTQTVELENESGKYQVNAYAERHQELIFGDEIAESTNQYGQSARVIWHNGDLQDLAEPLTDALADAFISRLNREAFLGLSREAEQVQQTVPTEEQQAGNFFTFHPVPKSKQAATAVQLGLFDSAPAETINRAQAYLSDTDQATVASASARLVSTIRTTERPDHESLVLVTARSRMNGQYLYKLYSNIREVPVSARWLSAGVLNHELKGLSEQLRRFDHSYLYQGDRSLEPAFHLLSESARPFTALQTFYRQGTLVIHRGEVGLIGQPSNGQAIFEPFGSQKDLDFYAQYIQVRDSYQQLLVKENEQLIADHGLRRELNQAYDHFKDTFGEFNRNSNRGRLLNDEAFGFMILSSLERKENDLFVKADIFREPLFPKPEKFTGEDAAEGFVFLNYKSSLKTTQKTSSYPVTTSVTIRKIYS